MKKALAMMKRPLAYYVKRFEGLNCNKRQGETAPHKAVMLLAVIEEVACGNITNGFVPLNERMVEAFERQWERHVGESALFNPVFATPFFHLEFESFWELMRRDPFQKRQEYTLPQLRENFYGAKIPDELCEYMAEPASRRVLQKALIEQYLPNSDAHRDGIAAEGSEAYNPDSTVGNLLNKWTA